MNDTPLNPIPLSLYVHFPWCARKCPYCDFNSHESSGPIPEQDYVNALLDDLKSELQTESRRSLHSIFMGGGTPSLFSADAIGQVLTGIQQKLVIEDAEITLEANPGTFDQAHFDGYRRAGVNRLSIGAQSFSAESLEALGRIHQPDDIQRSFDGARLAGFNRINLDLMHGLPGQSLEDAINDLEIAISLSPEHISWYQLTIEPNTRYYKYPPLLPDDLILEEIYVRGNELLEAAGYRQYEVSAYARPNEASHHNLNYWQFGDYLGIGAGAHGKQTRHAEVVRTTKTRAPKDYLDNPTATRKTVDAAELPLEFLLNCLRLSEGFDLALFEERTALNARVLDTFLQRAVAEEYLSRTDQWVVPTQKGRLFLNDLLMLAD